MKPADTTAAKPPANGHVRLGSRSIGASGLFPPLLVIAALLAGSDPRARAQAPPTEYEIKAAFLYNFAKFVDWPVDKFADPQAPVVLGIVGDDPFGAALDAMVLGKSVNGRAFQVKRLKPGPDLRSCHIVFVPASGKKHLPEILASLRGSSVLTVGETDWFVRSGGAVNFLLEDNKVRFEINVDAVARARLKISSKLLALARSVIDDRSSARD